MYSICEYSIYCTSVHCQCGYCLLASQILLVRATKRCRPFSKVKWLYCMDALLYQGRPNLTRAVGLGLSHSAASDSTQCWCVAVHCCSFGVLTYLSTSELQPQTSQGSCQCWVLNSVHNPGSVQSSLSTPSFNTWEPWMHLGIFFTANAYYLI